MTRRILTPRDRGLGGEISRFQRDRNINVGRQEQRHACERVADGQRLDVISLEFARRVGGECIGRILERVRDIRPGSRPQIQQCSASKMRPQAAPGSPMTRHAKQNM
jgi:hypothetical protein